MGIKKVLNGSPFMKFIAEWGFFILFIVAVFASRYDIWNPVSVHGAFHGPDASTPRKIDYAENNIKSTVSILLLLARQTVMVTKN